MSRSKIAALENLPKKPQSPDDLQPGESVCGGRFEIEARLGKGGVATVYRAKDATRGCTVALKILHHARAGDPRELQRFRNEIEINERIEPHPGLIQPFETGKLEGDGRPFLLSERGKGPTLDSLIIFAPLDEPRALDLFEDIATALGHMHDAGVLHRDVKPSNVIVEKDGNTERARLFDFGYAIAQRDIRELPPQDRLTQAGELPGTKHYMAPEQVLGHPATRTSDIYALGVSLYEALTGSPPYADLEPAEAAIRKASKGNQVPDIATKREGLSAGLATLVSDALASDPQDRVQDTRAFIARIRAIRESSGQDEAHEEQGTPIGLAPPLSQPSERVETPDTLQHPARSRLPLLALGFASAALLGVFGFWLATKAQPHELAPMGLATPQYPNPAAETVVPALEPTPPPEHPPTPEPQADPEPAPESKPPPQPPATAPAPSPKPSTPPRPQLDCEAERSAAKQAEDWGNWALLKKHTRHPKCWNSRLQWERLRAKALYKTGNTSACRKLASKSKHAEIQRYTRICASISSTESPQ